MIDGLAGFDVAYVHVTEAPDMRPVTLMLRRRWHSTFILNPATNPHPTGVDQLILVEDGTTDLISYGALFISNPDLPARLAAGGPFITADKTTVYGGDERGYTDYPALAG